MSARIHPTAVISPQADIADDVEVGPYAVIEGKVTIGRGTVIRPAAYLFGPLTMGEGNLVCTGAVLGEKPQHTKYQNEPTSLEIGDHNIFREHVTIHRGTTHSWKTVIGSHNFFMVHCHIAHDCVVGSRCVFVNGSMLGGHCQLSDQVYISGNSAVHQFCRMGRLAMLSGMSALTTDMPPFVVQQGHNTVSGLNLVGMRRAGMSHAQVDEAKHAFRIVYREGLTLPAALAKLEKEMPESAVVREILDFMHGNNRGLGSMRSRFRADAA